MHSSLRPSGGQSSLSEIAELIEAAGRLVSCIGQAIDDDNRPVLNVAAACLALHAGCVRLAADRLEGAADTLEVELLIDLAVADVFPNATPGKLMDDYVACQLEGAAAALDMLKIVYESDTNSLSQRISSALFAVVHWIEAARNGIAGWLRLQVA